MIMKKKSYTYSIIQRSILAIVMMGTAMTTWAQTNVAKIGTAEYATLQEAITAANAGETVELTSDITETVANTTNANSFTIDLGNHTWNYTQTSDDYAALKQDKEGSVITLKNGTMIVNGTEGFNVWARNGKVIIESGNYTINSNEDYNIYATSGYVEIYEGTFTNSNTNPYNHNASLKSLNLNVHNTLSSVEHIKVYGGTFTADPSKGDDSAWGTSTFVVDGYIVKTHETTLQTTYDVEPEVSVSTNLTNPTTEETTAAESLASNSSVSETTGLGDDGSLEVSITGVDVDASGNVTSATFEVTPKDGNGNTITTFSGTYTFRLPISAGIAAGKWVNLTHNGSPIAGNVVVADGSNRYVEVTTTSFSPFGYNVLPTDPVAKIGETRYVSVADAIDAATDNVETTIELIDNVTEDITIPADKKIVLKGEAYTLTGTITNNGTFKIVSGIFTTEPGEGWIASGSELMVGANNTFVVAAEGTAEAKIVVADSNATLYQTIALAINAAGTEETTITLLKDVAADITIPADAKITFDVATGVTISKPITVATGGTLTLTNGTFTGTITNNGTMTISGGTFEAAITSTDPAVLTITGGSFKVKPTGYTCETGKDLIIDNTGYYVVLDTANVEAKIGDIFYNTIADAITAAETTATTITLLKDPAADITIPADADITLEIQNVTTSFDALSKAITVNGTLAITSGTISGDITIADAAGKIKITDGVTLTNTAVALSDALATDKVLKSKTNDAAPAVTSYWVEKKFEAKVSLPNEASSEQTAAATTLAANNAISEVTLADNQSLTITVTSVEIGTGNTVKKATFEVKLIGADGEPITTEVPVVTFRLPVIATTSTTTWVNLWHDTTPIEGTSTIQGATTNQYIALSSTSFSPFSYEIIENPIAQIGETKYETVAKAIEKATATETEIKLLHDVSEAISISTKNVKLTIGTHTVSGNITNAGTLTLWDGTTDGGTNGVISGTITNTGTLNISDNANISGNITATNGTVTVSGGSISSAISTSGNAVLSISGGNFSFTNTNNDPAITIGGSGTNTISGTANVSGAVKVNTATLNISGGTFSNTITATGTSASSKGTITITGGTFTSTIAEEGDGDVQISGGTHSVLPTPALCATGFMPLVNEGTQTTYRMTNSWTVVDETDLSVNDHLNSGNYSVATATYNRYSGMVSAGNAATKYGTICLPFGITAHPAGMTLYKANRISGNTLTITAVTDYNTPIPAGTPLIFELSAAATNMTVTCSSSKVNTTDPTDPTDVNILRGTYSGETITTGLSNIYYLNGDAFHQAVNSLTVPKFRAYLYYEAPTPGTKPSVLTIVNESESETGLSETFGLEEVTEVYDLSGRKQNGLQKGMNIMRRADGSSVKVIVK